MVYKASHYNHISRHTPFLPFGSESRVSNFLASFDALPLQKPAKRQRTEAKQPASTWSIKPFFLKPASEDVRPSIQVVALEADSPARCQSAKTHPKESCRLKTLLSCSDCKNAAARMFVLLKCKNGANCEVVPRESTRTSGPTTMSTASEDRHVSQNPPRV
jgi:hypothetical protein